MGSDLKIDDDVKRLARTVGFYLATFLVGALVSFAYSYAPLHDSKNWKIDYLAERLSAHAKIMKEMETELTQLRSDAASRPDPETFRMLQDELVTTDKTIAQAEKKLERANRRIKELERSRGNWKKKHADAESARQSLAASAARALEASPESQDAAGVPAAPASPPAAPATPGADDGAQPAAVEAGLGQS